MLSRCARSSCFRHVEAGPSSAPPTTPSARLTASARGQTWQLRSLAPAVARGLQPRNTLAPVAPLLWVLPQTQGWFRWWADLFPITVFQQAIQVMVLKLGTALMVELTPGSLSNALLTLMLGIAVCWLTLKVPSLLRSRHSQAGLWNVVTLVAASRAVGAIGGAAAGGGGSTAGGAVTGGTAGRTAAAGRA